MELGQVEREDLERLEVSGEAGSRRWPEGHLGAHQFAGELLDPGPGRTRREAFEIELLARLHQALAKGWG